MTITFTNEEHKYLYTDKEMKLRCREDAPEEIKKVLRARIETLNEWVDVLNGKDGQIERIQTKDSVRNSCDR